MSSKHKYDLQIKEHHVDSLGHVNNATYLELFEEARWELISEKGYGFAKVQESQQGPVILEIQMKFFKELRLREKIQIVTELMEYPGKIGKLKQTMIKDDGQPACEAILVFGLFDMKARKLIEPTAEWLRAVK